MKSPFPGMDPFIEQQKWGDFHHCLITDLARTLSASLPKGFIATTEERSYIALIDEEGKRERHFNPDVKVSGPRRPAIASQPPPTAVAALDPECLELRAELEEEFVESFIDVYELLPERRLITSIEVLSPSNKQEGSGSWSQYLRKRQALIMGEANLVEIDLLRGGTRLPMRDPWPDSPYTLLVARKEQTPEDRKHLTPRCRVWKAYFDRPLPAITVPLEKPHADVVLDLQPLIDAIYLQMRYADQLDYDRPLDPPLTAKQLAWLKEQLRAREGKPAPPGKRKSQR